MSVHIVVAQQSASESARSRRHRAIATTLVRGAPARLGALRLDVLLAAGTEPSRP